MRRVFFHLPGTEFEIYSYGFLIMTGFLLAIWVASRRCRVVGIDPFLCIDLTVVLLIGGIIGSRLMYVLHFWDRLWSPAAPLGQNLVNLVNIRDGGLEFYGGLLLAAPLGIVYLRRKQVRLGRMFDIGFSVVPIGLVFGRMGCFLNGCCFGKRCAADGLWSGVAVAYPVYDVDGHDAIPFHHHLQQGWIPQAESGWVLPGPVGELPAGAVLQPYTDPLIPSQMVSSFANLVLFVLLAIVWARAYRQLLGPGQRRWREGEVACMAGMGYAVIRFGLELLREDTPPLVLDGVHILGKDGLTISQVVSLAILALSVGFYVRLRQGVIGRPIELLPGDEPSPESRPPPECRLRNE